MKGSYKAGVHTTDGLVIANGTLDVNATKAGIKGKDYVDIVGGTVKVTAGKTALNPLTPMMKTKALLASVTGR